MVSIIKMYGFKIKERADVGPFKLPGGTTCFVFIVFSIFLILYSSYFWSGIIQRRPFTKVTGQKPN